MMRSFWEISKTKDRSIDRETYRTYIHTGWDGSLHIYYLHVLPCQDYLHVARGSTGVYYVYRSDTFSDSEGSAGQHLQKGARAPWRPQQALVHFHHGARARVPCRRSIVACRCRHIAAQHQHRGVDDAAAVFQRHRWRGWHVA